MPVKSDSREGWRRRQTQKMAGPVHHPKQCGLYPEVSEKGF